ncbi:hypothetical protein ACPA74_27885, partial [Uniformispora flossi]
NGWLPRGDTGLWVVNSIGRVTRGGRELLVVVPYRRLSQCGSSRVHAYCAGLGAGTRVCDRLIGRGEFRRAPASSIPHGRAPVAAPSRWVGTPAATVAR